VPEPTGQAIEQVSTRVAYESPYLRLREDRVRRQDGSAGIYAYLERPDFALVIPAENDGFHLVEQYRYPARTRSWEFPQGTFPGLAQAPDAELLAREELRQETGFTARDLRHLGRLNCAMGMSSQRFDVWLASGLIPGTPELEVEEQDLRQRWFARTEVERMITGGVITDDSSVAAYALLMLRS
jgi:8-oxo-dGTP pyrophosphatase MutT (NUDIX family)